MAKRDEPIDQFIKDASTFTSDAEAKYKEYRGRRPKEIQMWQQAAASGWKDEHMAPLLKSLQPIIRREANKRMTGLGGSISRSALENELTIAAVKQLKSYDPEKAALSTHLGHGFRSVSTFIGGNRNATYMPVADVKRYEVFNNARKELHEELGRPPTPQELKTKLPWKVTDIKRMQKGFGREMYTDMGDGLSPDDQHARMRPRDAMFLARSQMSPEEQQFAERYFPPDGVTPPSIKNLAKALGISEARAYRLKASVESRVGPIYKRE
jgi:DNA-directed RNA polymerase specialized sigma subunit